ncbi:hypothetical protein SynA15127_02674 [Synechococcus sp. A15-127]|nr:hypothetical protein SynA15127_02674 [Synechococcus sp. A15-127]
MDESKGLIDELCQLCRLQAAPQVIESAQIHFDHTVSGYRWSA